MSGHVNAAVVLAALDAILDVAEDRSIHPQVRASNVRLRLTKLRKQVAEAVPEPQDSSEEAPSE